MAEVRELTETVRTGIQLDLSNDEALALDALLACVVYIRGTSPTEELQGIQDALEAAGYKWDHAGVKYHADPNIVNFPNRVKKEG